MNNPYRAAERGRNIHYSTFAEDPKTMDPAVSYSSDAYAIINLIYEMPFQYHYLKRPYDLVPSLATLVPVPKYYDRRGQLLGKNPPVHQVERAVYEINITPGVKYQPHPAFAKDASGRPRYQALTDEDVKHISQIRDFVIAASDTKELTAADFIYQIKRLADPQLHCPILETMSKYIFELEEYAAALKKDLQEERERRKKKKGVLYSQQQDELEQPIQLDYDKHSFHGVLPGSSKNANDPYAYRIVLKTKYPQIRYWLAMPFFCPMPKEVVSFYGQGPLAKKNITLTRFPVGTGPYMMTSYALNREIVLDRNPNFHGERYPSEGMPEDQANGMLNDAGAPLPFVDRKVIKREKEALPVWNKFLQGYYDGSAVPSDSFDQAIQMSPEGQASLTAFLKERGIRLETDVATTTYYMGFNMLDPVVGGYTEDKQKLRQAISIALDMEERIEIFDNGRGVPAHDIIAPGIFGYEQGQAGFNPYVYQWDEKTQSPARKSLEEAKRLLAEAGYPGGKDKNGKQLVIGFDNQYTSAGSAPLVQWYIKKFAAIGIHLESRTTDYNRFQEKMHQGNFQFFAWGWNADYPDPENFLFLLYGPNSTVKVRGENHANYANPEFDRLFKQVESMENDSERLTVIRKMKDIMRRDAPIVWGYHPVGYGLYHSWMFNSKPNSMANNTFKYQRMDPELRERYRERWNQPVWWPVGAVGAFIAASVFLAIRAVRRQEGAG